MRLLLAPVVLVLLLATGCGGDGGESAATTAEPATTSAPVPATSADGCHTVEAPEPEERTAPKPSTRLDPSKRYDLTLQTNCGSFTIRLDAKGAPATTASLVSLARRGYFDHTVVHRIVPGCVIQGGDPSASGAVTTKNWLPLVPAGSVCVFAIATTPWT